VLFDSMDINKDDGVLFVSKINCDPLLWNLIILLHNASIFQNKSGFNPEIAVGSITDIIVSFYQRTVTPVSN
jgi:hypothetical protein